jgi:methyl-accepting chemotaxis protein
VAQPVDSPRSLSIYTKTFLTMLSVALIPLSFVGMRNVLDEQAQTTARVDRQFEQEARVLATDVAGWIDTNIRALQQNALLPEIRSGVPARQIPVLHAIANTYRWAFLVATIGGDGKNVARSDLSPPMEYNDREYFRQAMAGAELGYQVLIAKTTGKPALALATSFPVDTGGKAVLMTSSHLSDVSDAIAATRIGHTGFSFLLDGKGRVIAHPSPEFQGKLVDLSTHPAFQATRSAEKARVIYTEAGKEFVAHAVVTRLGWVIVVQQETTEAFAPIRDAIQNTVITVLAVAAVALLASYLLARALTLPILRLTTAADAVSRGETNVAIVEVDRGDELGGLARAIDRMRVSIDVAMKRLRRGTGGQA